MTQIPDEFDLRLPYRIGSRTLPALPVETTAGPWSERYKHIPNFDGHEKNVETILKKYNIPFEGLLFVHRISCGMDPADATDHQSTFLVTCEYEDESKDQWVKALVEIHESLIQDNVHYTIEMISEKVRRDPLLRVSPILSTDQELIRGWRNVRPEFLATISTHQWTSVDVFNREFPSCGEKPTAIIHAQDADDASWWTSTMPTLRQLLEAQSLTLDIVLLSGGPCLLNTPEAHHRICNDFYERPAAMGTSIGASNSDSTGTLGGRLKLGTDSCNIEVGLTNYHVLLDAFNNEGSTSTSESFPPNTGRVYAHMPVVSPSDSDHQAQVGRLVRAATELKNSETKILKRYESLFDGESDEPIQHSLSRISDKLKVVNGDLDDANQCIRPIGHAYAASGFRTCENPRYDKQQRLNWALDWSLIQLDKPRSVSNELMSVSLSSDKQYSGYAKFYANISADKHYKVMKRGRTTEWTNGTVSAIESTLNKKHVLPNLKTPTYQKIKMEKRWENMAVFVHPILGTKKVPQFMQSGDSGSFVLLDEDCEIPDEKAEGAPVQILGLGFAANADLYTSYMMPFDLIIADIEKVTGVKVIEPECSGLV
ncbi:hypothetical protein GQ44DRAFT_731066 [Phaeosphaeriaceae sp. PMI808]|nr:hypothetical protein GQ44DRAFT_731066 [Phaeosphaeriaceae sp. PMI808]